MRTLFRRSLPIFILLLLLTPVVVFAQSGTAAQLIELVFSDDESSVQIEDTIQSVARVTFTHDGKTYVMKAPVTIAVDSTIPLAESMLTTDAAARVGVFAVEILKVTEPEEIEGLRGEITPSASTNKLIAVSFRVTNLGDQAREFPDKAFRIYESVDDYKELVGIDDLGRRFNFEEILGCGEVNPSGHADCVAVFDVANQVTFSKIKLHVMDEGVISVPPVEDSEEEEEE